MNNREWLRINHNGVPAGNYTAADGRAAVDGCLVFAAAPEGRQDDVIVYIKAA